MKNSNLVKWLVLADIVFLLLYSSLMFILVSQHDLAFYTIYGFTAFAIVSFGFALHSIIFLPKNLKEAFLNEPYFTISLFYLIGQLIYGIWAQINADVAYKFILSGNILLCGTYLVVLILLHIVIRLNKSFEHQTEEERHFILRLRQVLVEISSQPGAARQYALDLQKFIETVIPYSSEKAQSSENKILEIAYSLGQTEDEQLLQEYEQEIKHLLIIRNEQCKL